MNTTQAIDPGLLPDELLHVPGFITEVMAHTLATAPRPNRVAALAGALALQAFLAGRQVCGPGGIRANLYVLALGPGGCGKDHPRVVNARIMAAAGAADFLGGGIASWQGLEDALCRTPSMLFQMDEIRALLGRFDRARGGRHREIHEALVRLHDASAETVPTRHAAGSGWPAKIVDPSLTILGTAMSRSCFEALSERTCDLFTRMLVLESATPEKLNGPGASELPPAVVETARWWIAHQRSLDGIPEPMTVSQNEAAMGVLDCVPEATAEPSCEFGRQCWRHARELAVKLALLHAVSECPHSPRIGLAAAEWGARLARHSANRLLFVAHARPGGCRVPGCGHRMTETAVAAGANRV
jgi:hypothetical protein